MSTLIAATDLRAARSIHDNLVKGLGTQVGDLAETMPELLARQRALAAAWKRVGLASSRGWSAALRETLAELPWQLESLQGHAGRARDLARSFSQSRQPPGLRAILAELDQLRDEFGHVGINLETCTLGVDTSRIELEDIDLGAFRIHLRWGRLAEHLDDDAFNIEALQPNGAGGQPDITHPHVSHGRLCAGEASVPVQQALLQGRLCDAFLLIRGVLETYNPESAYVRLEEWYGYTCDDCGSRLADEDRCICDACDRDYCPDCTTRCSCCDGRFCLACAGTSALSDRVVCSRCAVTCRACDRRVASDEIDADLAVCTDCADQRQTDQELPAPNPTPNNEESSSHAQAEVTPTTRRPRRTRTRRSRTAPRQAA